jgi:small nuclear ribonucleoprotein (snRNP)-like protein
VFILAESSRANAKGRSSVENAVTDAPTHLLERVLQQRVTLTLKDSRTLSGKLLGLDEHMNLVLDDADETTTEVSRHLGRVVLRGSNVVSLHAPQGATGKPT